MHVTYILLTISTSPRTPTKTNFACAC
jgi:hypothetical protein